MAREVLKIRPHMPIILCTGFSHSLELDKAMAMGISDLLYKPILLDQLSHTVASILAKSRPNRSEDSCY